MPNLLWEPGLINMVCLSILCQSLWGVGWGYEYTCTIEEGGIVWGKDHNEYYIWTEFYCLKKVTVVQAFNSAAEKKF